MRLPIVPALFLPILVRCHSVSPDSEYSITSAPVYPIQSAQPLPASLVGPTVLPTLIDSEEVNLELRQVAAGGGAQGTTAATQAPTFTSYWIETLEGGSTTWVEVLYTQTFASVPDQWPTVPSPGNIGMGTLTGSVGVVRTNEASAAVISRIGQEYLLVVGVAACAMLGGAALIL